jgi:SNF2 family DNA or RNA helicase
MLSCSDLHQYQHRAVQFILDHPHCALWVDLGLGKTITTLTALEELINGVEVGKVLIIAPLRVANSVWAQEVKAWEHTRPLRVSICTGSTKERNAALHREAEIYVINRENVVWLVKKYGKDWPFDCVVIDEASSFKSSDAKRWKALKSIRPYVRRMIQLTGTPASNGLLDLWPQLYLLDLGQRLGRTKTAYRDRFFASDYMGFKWSPRPGAEDKIHALVDDVVLSLRAEDYLSVPDRINLSVRVDLPEEAVKQYKSFEREFVLALGNEGEEVDAVNAAVLAGKLQQICNGAIYKDEEKNFHVIHDAKIEALREIIEDNPSENILVAYQFKHDLARLREAFPQARVLDKGQQVIEDWNNGEIPLLLAHPASAGHGLNLQRGGACIVWFGLNWSLELYDQFCGRLHRQGQTRPVRVIHLLAAGCIDDRVMDAIAAKAKTQTDLLNALKLTVRTV